METVTIANDIKVFYMTATSFPDGIMGAFNKLYALVPFSSERKFYGISRPENGKIVYRAAAEEIQNGEAEKYHCDTLVIKKGNYVSVTITDFMKDTRDVAKAFQQLLDHAGIDPDGYCVEWYPNQKDVVCMVRMAG